MAASAAIDKKANNTVILYLRELTIIADYFVVCSGDNPAQVSAISDNIQKKFLEKGIRAAGIEGTSSSRWILLDYGDVIIHIFDEETRAYYELEKLWLDAPRIPVVQQ